MLKGRQTPLSNSKSVKVAKNVIDFYFQKWNSIIRFSNEIKFLPIDPGFSNRVNFAKKVLIISCSKSSKSFKTIFFS